jgi:hypothetical protein
MYVGDGSVTALVVDSNGNVYVTGLGFNFSVTGHDYCNASDGNGIS